MRPAQMRPSAASFVAYFPAYPAAAENNSPDTGGAFG